MLIINVLTLLTYKLILSLGFSNDNTFLMLPLGLSFVVFTMIGYIADVNRGNLKPEPNIAKLSLYFLFFPKLVQGPIERGGDFLPQINKETKFDYNLFTTGLKYIIIGFIKKLVIADRIAVLTENVFDNVYNFHGISLIIAVLLYSFQIYADFSGYTDIAIGSASLFGYKLSENFKKPYSSKSISEFWRKWHITLSNWLRDYIFLPIAYNLTKSVKANKILFLNKENFVYITAIFVTFAVCGLWHGIGLNFLIWGLNFAVFLSFSRITKKYRNKIVPFKIRKTFLIKYINLIFIFILISFNWIFFRSDNIYEAVYIIKYSFSGISELISNISNFGYIRGIFSAFGLNTFDLKIIIFGILALSAAEVISKEKNIIDYINGLSVIPRWVIYYTLIFVLIFYSSFNKTQDFIYLQF